MNALIVVRFSSIIIFLITATISASSNETDYQALLQLKSMITNEGLSSWNSSFHFCDWKGVSCGKRHKRVTALLLNSQGLQGSFSPYVGNLSFLRGFSLRNNSFQGTIPHELGRLSRLSFLDLANNNFTGVIPSNLSGCSNLEELHLSYNKLVGSIPKEIGFLSKLGLFNVRTNTLTGGIPPVLGNITTMEVFSAAENLFGGSIPHALGRWKSLTEFYVGGCKLSGTIPLFIFNLSLLANLSLAENQLIGSLPSALGEMLPHLKYLQLQNNQLSGPIPPSISNCSKLKYLELTNNKLVGSIPHKLGNCKSITELYVGGCNLTGTIPLSIYNLSLLTRFSVAENQLVGSLPSALGEMLPHLKILQLRNNQLDGPLPSSISNCSKLEFLEVNYNNFRGKLTIDFSQLRDIYYISLGGNNVFGSGEADDMKFIDTLKNCSRLKRLQLSDCKLQGVLPTSIGNLSDQLSILALNKNDIYGYLPTTIGNLVGLIGLSLAENRFTGKIPSTIGKLQNLQEAYLFDNQFSGPIPDSIGNLSLLTALWLDSNSLEQHIPSSLGNCHNLLDLHLDDNKLSGKIPIQILQLSSLTIALNLSHNNLSGSLPTEVGNLKMLTSLDLSYNNLSGTIPNSLGGCTSLSVLSLRGNLFQGIVPPSLGSMRGVSTLDLSHNNLSGQIPQFLEQLTLLEYVNLSFNDFEGDVPAVGVFSNVSAFSVMGNNRLCGGLAELRLTKCKETENHKNRFLLVIILILIASTFLCISCIVYACCKKRRGQSSESVKDERFMRVSYSQLLKATNGFSQENLIGEGGFSSVYIGTLDGHDDKYVAVKVIHLQTRGAHKSFIAECEAWRSIRHRNLLKIITSCSSVDFQGNDFKSLVYEYMPNGSLHDWLHSSASTSRLNLIQRINILIDVASALDYLHNHCLPTIVHCDLKPSNILLDDDMVAHVGDFGLARLLRTNSNQSSTSCIKGTIGYAPPEYGVAGEMTSSGDVYSFGILLLEVMTGKRPTDHTFNEGLNLHKFSCMALPNCVPNVIDDGLLNFLQKGATDKQCKLTNSKEVELCMASIVKIGVSCSVDSPPQRMKIENVVYELQHILDTVQNI